MPQLIEYRLSDGAIMSICESYSRDVLAHNRHNADPAYGYLERDEVLPLMEQDRFAVVEGEVIAKQAITIVARPTPFPADGETPCEITVEPFVPCILLVNDEQVTLSASDPTLLLTADAPQRFTLSLVSMPGRWAVPVTVEAH